VLLWLKFVECGLWLRISFFPKILSKYLCHESIILLREIYYNFEGMLELLLSCVNHLHHDGQPSCGKSLALYLRVKQKSSTKHTETYCKMVLIINIAFLTIFCTLSCLPNPYYFHRKTESFFKSKLSKLFLPITTIYSTRF